MFHGNNYLLFILIPKLTNKSNTKIMKIPMRIRQIIVLFSFVKNVDYSVL